MTLMIRGKKSGEYFVIECQQCKEETDNEYLGWVSETPQFRATCGKCGTHTTLKLTGDCWQGLPRFPA